MKLTEGDRVQIITRAVTESDRATNRYFEYMGGLTGSVQNIYAENEVAVRIDVDVLSKATRDVLKEATERMRVKVIGSLSEAQKKELTAQEMEFDVNFMQLVHSSDLEKV